MDLLKHTLFINLDHRKDRLEHCLHEFDKMGISAERVSAVKMASGAVGCTLSHIKCLELAKERKYDHVFICEDDITFLNPSILHNRLQCIHDHPTILWDVLIIGGNNVPPYDPITDFCVKVYLCQTTTGYIVKSHYYDTLIRNFRESAAQLLRDPENKPMYALDMYWKRLQQRDQWLMLIPATVTQYESYSDIENRVVDYTHLMLDTEKSWLRETKDRSP